MISLFPARLSLAYFTASTIWLMPGSAAGA
jgi:hypothetical protein